MPRNCRGNSIAGRWAPIRPRCGGQNRPFGTRIQNERNGVTIRRQGYKGRTVQGRYNNFAAQDCATTISTIGDGRHTPEHDPGE